MNTLPLTNQPPSDLLLPVEVIQTLATKYKEAGYAPEAVLEYVAWEAAQWGADKELEACCAWIPEYFQWNRSIQDADQLRAARRPKPPTLKEQALAILDDCSDRLDGSHENIIRRALEQLK